MDIYRVQALTLDHGQQLNGGPMLLIVKLFFQPAQVLLTDQVVIQTLTLKFRNSQNINIVSHK